MSDQPLVSAIVSLYKAEKFIRAKLDDLLQQTLGPQLEIIIVNSGSPQNERAIIDEYLKNHTNIIYIETEERESIYAAWNRGIKSARGKYITNSNADDYLRVDALEIMANKLRMNPEVHLVYASQVLTNVPLQRFEDAYSRKNIIHAMPFDSMLLHYRCFIGSQPMWRASLHNEENIWFSEKYEIAGDYEFELRVAETHKFMHISQPLGTFYKAVDKSNRETVDLARTTKETEEILDLAIPRFLDAIPKADLHKYARRFRAFLHTPILFLYVLKRIDFLLTSPIYPRLIPYSIEFVYYMSGQLLYRMGEIQVAIKYLKRYLRYWQPRKIISLLAELESAYGKKE